MSAPTAPEWIFDIGSQGLNGLLDSFTSHQTKAPGVFVRNDGNERKFRLVTTTGQTELRPWQDIDLTGATVEFAIGALDRSPTGGTFGGSSNGDTTGLVALAYNVTAAALQAALNTNPDVTSGGATVAVQLFGTTYIITWSAVGARSLIVWDGALLTPEGTATGSRIQTGTAGVKEIQLLRLIQRPYAYVAPTTAYPVAAATITSIQTGTATLPSKQRVLLDPPPYDGVFVLNGGKPEITRVIAKANTGSAFEVSTITCAADVAGSMHDTTVGTIYDSAGPVQVLLTNGGAITTSIPAGGRRLSVTIVNGDSAATIAGKVQVVIEADAQYGATVSTSQVTVTDAAYGTRVDIANGTAAGTETAVVTQGAFGILHDTYFTLYDATNSSTGVYLTQTGSAPASGHPVLALGRYISVTVAAGASATTVGGNIQTQVDADADFIATAATGTVTITAAANGVRSTASAGTSTFPVASTSTGVAVSATIDYDADETTFADAIGSQFTVTKTGTFQWDIAFVQNGAQSLFAAVVTGLKVPTGLIGELNLNTVQMASAFASVTDDFTTAILEGSITFPGKKPITFYRETVDIYKDVIDFSTLAPTATVSAATSAQILPLTTGYIGGTATDLDSVETASRPVPQLVAFKHAADGGRFYWLRAGTDAEASPNIIRPDDFALATNEKVWESFL